VCSSVCKHLYSPLCWVGYCGTDADCDIDLMVEAVTKAPFYLLANSLDWTHCCTSIQFCMQLFIALKFWLSLYKWLIIPINLLSHTGLPIFETRGGKWRVQNIHMLFALTGPVIHKHPRRLLWFSWPWMGRCLRRSQGSNPFIACEGSKSPSVCRVCANSPLDVSKLIWCQSYSTTSCYSSHHKEVGC